VDRVGGGATGARLLRRRRRLRPLRGGPAGRLGAQGRRRRLPSPVPRGRSVGRVGRGRSGLRSEMHVVLVGGGSFCVSWKGLLRFVGSFGVSVEGALAFRGRGFCVSWGALAFSAEGALAFMGTVSIF
jgi:hypothetical protein